MKQFEIDEILSNLVILLQEDQLEFRKVWNRNFPQTLLEKFANEHGISFD